MYIIILKVLNQENGDSNISVAVEIQRQVNSLGRLAVIITVTKVNFLYNKNIALKKNKSIINIKNFLFCFFGL